MKMEPTICRDAQYFGCHTEFAIWYPNFINIQINSTGANTKTKVMIALDDKLFSTAEAKGFSPLIRGPGL